MLHGLREEHIKPALQQYYSGYYINSVLIGTAIF